MAIFSKTTDDIQDDVEAQIAALRKEVSSLSRALSKRGASAYRGASDEAADLYGDIAQRISDSLPTVRRQAQQFERTVRDHPTQSIAIAGLAALALAATIVFARR